MASERLNNDDSCKIIKSKHKGGRDAGAKKACVRRASLPVLVDSLRELVGLLVLIL